MLPTRCHREQVGYDFLCFYSLISPWHALNKLYSILYHPVAAPSGGSGSSAWSAEAPPSPTPYRTSIKHTLDFLLQNTTLTTLHRVVKKSTVESLWGKEWRLRPFLLTVAMPSGKSMSPTQSLGSHVSLAGLPPGAPSTHELVLESLSLFSSVEWEGPS